MRMSRIVRLLAAWMVLSVLMPAAAAGGAYKNFRAAIYITVNDTKRLADPATFERDFARVSSQLHFDKVYIEAYRDRLLRDRCRARDGQARVPGEGHPDLGRRHARGGRLGRAVRHFRLREPRRPRRMREARCA